jgi:hypothetical protein
MGYGTPRTRYRQSRGPDRPKSQTRTNHALHLVNQITHAIELKFSGYPKRYHGTDADLQKLEAALATLTA